jgi:hypothetical protein
VETEQRENERRDAAGQDKQAEREARDVRQPGQHERDDPRQEHPEAHERKVTERSQSQSGIDARCVGEKTLASETIETELQDAIRPQEGPQWDSQDEPRHSAQDRGRPAVIDQRDNAERNRRGTRKRERAEDAVQLARTSSRRRS